MTNQPGRIESVVGNPCGLRTGVEDGFKHAKDKDDLGWADYRLTDSTSMERGGTGHERLSPGQPPDGG